MKAITIAVKTFKSPIKILEVITTSAADHATINRIYEGIFEKYRKIGKAINIEQLTTNVNSFEAPAKTVRKLHIYVLREGRLYCDGLYNNPTAAMEMYSRYAADELYTLLYDKYDTIAELTPEAINNYFAI